MLSPGSWRFLKGVSPVGVLAVVVVFATPGDNLGSARYGLGAAALDATVGF